MPQSFTCLHYHFIFSTRNRAPLISTELQPRLYDYLGGLIRREGGVLVAAGGTADHVHLLTSISKERTITATLRDIKATSSRWIRETFAEHTAFGWQAGYGAFTVGHSGLGNVKAYIERQEEHHRTVTFQEEFLEFLRRYEIPYDERYLWS